MGSSGVHEVIRWPEPRCLSVDTDVVRGDLERAVHSAADADDDITELLRRGGYDIAIISPSARGGVEVQPFPDLYRCRQCGRLRVEQGQMPVWKDAMDTLPIRRLSRVWTDGDTVDKGV